MTYKNLVDKLNALEVNEPEVEALMILGHFFCADRSKTLLFPDFDYDDALIEPILKRRSTGEPIQYIIGRVFFLNTEIRVSPDCLIPRYDTEILCEYLIDKLPQSGHFLELCTGSGCIPIAVLAHRGDLTCEAMELIPKTAALAKENRELNKLSPKRMSVTVGDALTIDPESRAGCYDAIVSNPPYIRTDVIPHLSKEVRFEPEVALDGGSDGLIFYRKFISTYSSMLKPGGFFAFEIGYDQADDIKKLCDIHGFSLEILKDYSKNDRVAIIHP
jgi:release factor glutamine methyltransferase